MSERATVFEGAQIGVETSPGSGGTANLIMEAFGLTPSKQGKVDVFRPEGMKFGTIASVGKIHAEWKVDGVLDYVNVLYLLRGLMQMTANPAQQGATTAYLWTFTSKTSDADNCKTYRIERGSSVAAARYLYGVITGLGFAFGAQDSTVKLTGAAVSQKAARGITLATPTTGVAAVPTLPGHFAMKYATAKGDLGAASALTRLFNLEWGLTNKASPVFNIGTAASYVAHVEVPPDLTGSITVAADTVGETLEGHAEAATPLWVQITATGGVIAGAYNYGITITMPVYLVTLGEASDADGVWALKFGLQGRHDGSDGKAIEVAVMSKDIAGLHV